MHLIHIHSIHKRHVCDRRIQIPVAKLRKSSMIGVLKQQLTLMANDDEETRIRKTIVDSALDLKVIKCGKDETPILMAKLYTMFSDESAVCYMFLVSGAKDVSSDVKSYALLHVMPETYETVNEFVLYRKDISPTRTSNMVSCVKCKETHFQWTDAKLELTSNEDDFVELVDPLTLPLEYLMKYDSVPIGVSMRKILEEDMYDK